MVLFGFPSRDERDTFEALIAATGVGPKLALAILSVHTPSALRRCLADDDLDALVLVPGRRASAPRSGCSIELKAAARGSRPRSHRRCRRRRRRRAARCATRSIGLGYSSDEVRDVLGQLADDGTVEELLRDALRVLAGRDDG